MSQVAHNPRHSQYVRHAAFPLAGGNHTFEAKEKHFPHVVSVQPVRTMVATAYYASAGLKCARP